MSQEFTPQEGCCSCYSNTFTINQMPMARFICHCTICQDYTGKAYNDVTVLLKSDVSELEINKTRFRRWKMPPNISRGLCKRCHKPSIEKAVGGNLILIPSENYPNKDALPKPSMHLFYNRRVRDVEDNLPKYEGFVQSQTMVVKQLAQSMYKKVVKR